MKFKEVKEEWEKDCVIPYQKYDLASIETPKLLSKYLNYWSTAKESEITAARELESIKKDAFIYYTGKAVPESYEDVGPKQLKIMKTDVNTFIDGDEKVQAAKTKLDKMKYVVWYLEQVLKHLGQRDWTIKNSIEWRKHLDGV